MGETPPLLFPKCSRSKVVALEEDLRQSEGPKLQMYVMLYATRPAENRIKRSKFYLGIAD